MEYDALLNEAFEAMKNAYAPYSNYHVGACLETVDGKLFRGVNVENCSFGATNCAERSALFAAISNGYKKGDFETVAIVSDGERIAAPCGICRQAFSEFVDSNFIFHLSNSLMICIECSKPSSFEKIFPKERQGTKWVTCPNFVCTGAPTL